jgi:hypothetical protein
LSKYHNFDSNNYEKVRRRAKFEALTKGSQKNNRHRKNYQIYLVKNQRRNKVESMRIKDWDMDRDMSGRRWVSRKRVD